MKGVLYILSLNSGIEHLEKAWEIKTGIEIVDELGGLRLGTITVLTGTKEINLISDENILVLSEIDWGNIENQIIEKGIKLIILIEPTINLDIMFRLRSLMFDYGVAVLIVTKEKECKIYWADRII